jgi:putative membrane protein
MIRLVACLFLACGFVSTTAFATDPSTAAAAAGTVPATGTFIAKTESGNLFEIDSSKLALRKSKSERVRTFANMVVTDHVAARAKLGRAASDAGMTAPPEALDARQAALLNGLKTEDGESFDKAYVDALYEAHVETTEMFEAYARHGDNARLKQFANEMLPTLQTHLDHAIKLR